MKSFLRHIPLQDLRQSHGLREPSKVWRRWVAFALSQASDTATGHSYFIKSNYNQSWFVNTANILQNSYRNYCFQPRALTSQHNRVCHDTRIIVARAVLFQWKSRQYRKSGNNNSGFPDNYQSIKCSPCRDALVSVQASNRFAWSMAKVILLFQPKAQGVMYN